MYNLKYRLLFKLYHHTKKWKIPFRTNRLLLVKLDAIGDYIIFRNFIHTLKKSKKFSKYKFTLLGNVLYKDLAEHFDKDVIDNFIWINPSSLINQSLQSLVLYFKIKILAFDILINPTHSKVKYIEDFILNLGIKHTICSSGDTVNLNNEKSLIEINSRYNEVVSIKKDIFFEFNRNQDFILNLISPEKLETTLQINQKKIKNQNRNKNILIFPGASSLKRRWSIENFEKLIRYINADYKVDIKILGSKEDSLLANYLIKKCLNINIEDFTGKTTLVELVDLINSGDLLITNETSANHIAAATATASICISNGNHFGRFNPYPVNFITTIYPNDRFYDGIYFNEMVNLYSYESNLEINTITPEHVFESVKKYLNYNN